MKNRFLLTISVIFLAVHSIHAQSVGDGGRDGLMKTVTYDVEHFTDIRDKKLSDVLVKMPGISGEGTWYSYNGMGIEKVYINGADVLEGNTQPAYNLKPQDVERIEITENHIPIKVMRGKMYSSSASLNVVMKDSSGGRWSGSVKAMAGGAPLLGTADVNAMNLGPESRGSLQFKTFCILPGIIFRKNIQQ